MNPLPFDIESAMARVHPDTRCEHIRLEPPRYNPVQDVIVVGVCYQEEITQTVKRWFRAPLEVKTLVHKHHNAVSVRGKPWEWVGVPDMPPLAIARELMKVRQEIQSHKGELCGPDIIAPGIHFAFDAWDALAREQFFDLMLDMPKFGDELIAYVRRADRIKNALGSKN